MRRIQNASCWPPDFFFFLSFLEKGKHKAGTKPGANLITDDEASYAERL